jgi:hypothetical protein
MAKIIIRKLFAVPIAVRGIQRRRKIKTQPERVGRMRSESLGRGVLMGVVEFMVSISEVVTGSTGNSRSTYRSSVKEGSPTVPHTGPAAERKTWFNASFFRSRPCPSIDPPGSRILCKVTGRNTFLRSAGTT